RSGGVEWEGDQLCEIRLMTRRGKCRCGAVLDFKETPCGFKMRCPQCHAIVRLRQEQSSTKASSRNQRAPFPTGALPDLPPGDLETTDFNILSDHESNAPRAVAEMEVFDPPEPTPVPPFHTSVWFWLACMAVVIVVGAGSAWMFWE